MTESDAFSLIRDVGRTVTLRQRPAVVGTPVDLPVVAAVRDAKDADMDGVTVLRGDRKYLLSAASVTEAPSVNGDWSVVEGTTERRIVGVQEHTGVAGAVIAYDLTARI